MAARNMDESRGESETKLLRSQQANTRGDCTARPKAPVYIHVNLDHITHNIRILRSRCASKNTGVIAVVKADAYGHGLVQVSNHLKKIGVERLAVATVDEGIVLRRHNIQGPIHVFSTTYSRDMAECFQYDLIPTVSDTDTVHKMSEVLNNIDNYRQLIEGTSTETWSALPRSSVNIMGDTEISSYGCQPEDLPTLVKKCREEHLNIDSILTQFSASWLNRDFTEEQLNSFLAITEPYRSFGIKRHVADSGAILRGYGTDLDYIRPGTSIFGLTLEEAATPEYIAFGFKPVISVIGYPTSVDRVLDCDRVECRQTEPGVKGQALATFDIGYANGYLRRLSGKGVVIRDKTGERCPLVGEVRFDTITVQVPGDTSVTESFTLLSADYDPVTSASGFARLAGVSPVDVLCHFARLPRLYTESGEQTYITSTLVDIY